MKPEDSAYVALMIALNRAQVRWLLIGRHALIQYGAPLQTMDLDLWVDPAPENVSRFVKVAQELGFLDSHATWDVSGRELLLIYKDNQKVDVFLIRTFTNLDGKKIDFERAYGHRSVAEAEGDALKVSLPSLGDLRLLKRMRDSEKDREDLRCLDLLLKEKR